MNILDKEEFRVKLGQINKLVETQDYKGAMQIVDSIDWRRVKNVRTRVRSTRPTSAMKRARKFFFLPTTERRSARTYFTV